MVGRYQDGVTVRVFASTQPRDRIGRVQQRLRRKLAKRDDHLWRDRVDLPQQERLALCGFIGLGIAIAWRPALDEIRDVDVRPGQADCFDDLGKELTGTTD